jgi:regulator of sigma E protease
MEVILKIIGAVLILSFLVIIHELGHYWAAKKNGVKVPEFGVGFPPTLFKFKKWGTTFKINAVPLGGYVKLHGEDAHDPKLLKDKSSFASKTPWQKIEIILAGVLMNFLVFWVLMTAALWSGVTPLVTSQDDFRTVVNEGYFRLSPEILVESSEDDRFRQGDRVVSVNGSEVISRELAVDLVRGKYELVESIQVKSGMTVNEFDFTQEPTPNVEFFPITSVPMFEVTNVTADSAFNEVVYAGDKIYRVNNKPAFDIDVFWTALADSNFDGLNLSLLRNGESIEVQVPFEENYYFVEEVLSESPAEEAGFQVGDQIIAVDGLIVEVGHDIPKQISDKGLSTVVFTVDRRGIDEHIDLVVNPNEDGTVGVFLTGQLKLSEFGIDLVPTSRYGSVIKIKDLRVPIYQAPFVALTQGHKIAVATVKGFSRTVYGIVTSFHVSEEVGGPVQVAKLSYDFIDRGGVDLINFIALISLSLAVINLLPIPALDGGRFVFIIIEALRGKPINQRVEAMIHTIGFFLLIGLILVISMFDIIRL